MSYGNALAFGVLFGGAPLPGACHTTAAAGEDTAAAGGAISPSAGHTAP